jgi:hypothetical protein
MRPSLIIGIGGTGLAIGYSLKYFIYNLLSEEDRKYFKFVFIDNDKNQFSDYRTNYISKLGDYTNEIIKISDFEPYPIYRKVKDKEDRNKPIEPEYQDLLEWYDSQITVNTHVYEEGLAANRMIGRMCGYVHYLDIENKISYACKELIELVQERGRKFDDKSMIVYIITSNSGGTGSSLFFDVSVIVDNNLNNSSRQIPKTLIFVGPNYYLAQKRAKNYSEDAPEYVNLQINSWAFVEECEFFINYFYNDATLMAKYFCRPSVLKNKINTGHIFSPFTSAWVFDHITSKNKKISDDKFFNSIAEILFYSLTSSSHDDYISKIAVNTFIQRNNAVPIQLDQYMTVGIKVLRYPVEEFAEYFRIRYLYEFFKKLLNKNPDETKIKNKANEFIYEAFKNPQNNIIKNKAFTSFDQHIQSNVYASYMSFKQNYETNPLNLFKKDGSDKFKDKEELNKLFEEHDNYFETFIRTIENIYNYLRNTNAFAAFRDLYKDRGNASDDLRKKLWEKAYDVIAEEGYYGIIGVVDTNYKIKGYCEIIREELCKFYSQIAGEYSQIDTLISNKKKEINNLRDNIIKKSATIIGRNKVTKANKEISQYISSLKEYRNLIIQKYYLRITQELLYYFAVGDSLGITSGAILRGSAFESQLADDTELTKYEKEIRLRIGESISLNEPFRMTLMKKFDDTKSDSDTIKNRYVKRLTEKFRETEKDVFTTYIPFRLDTLVDHTEEDGWKKNNQLSKIFNSNIRKIEKAEIDSMIEGPKKENWKFKFALLLDIDVPRKSLESIIEEIISTVNNYFEYKYIQTDTEISRFLSKTIDRVIMEDLSDKSRREIIEQIVDVEYPINAPNLKLKQQIGPYYNVHPDLKQFVEKTFQVRNPNDIVTNSELSKNKIVAVLYKRGLAYKDLTGNDNHYNAYYNRDKNIYRPFLNKSWNNHTRGPWDDPELKKIVGTPTIKIKIGRKEKEINYKELIAFLVGIDLLLKKSKKLYDSIFNKDKALKELKNPSIIFYDDSSSQFFYLNSLTNQNKKLKIDLGFGQENLKPLNLSLNLIKIKSEINRGINLLDFEKSAQLLSKNDDFKNSLIVFLNALSNQLRSFKSLFKKEKSNIKTNLNGIAKEIYNDSSIRQSFNGEDLRFASEFDKIMNDLLNEFFG